MESSSSKLGLLQGISLAGGVSIVLGLSEAIVLRVGLGQSQLYANRVLLAIVMLYGLLGLALGIVAVVIGRGDVEASAVALPPAVLAAGAVVLRGASWLSLAAAVGLAFLTYSVLVRILRRYRLLLRPRPWWAVTAVTLAAALALSARGAPDRTGLVGALAVPVGCLLMWLGTRRAHPLAGTLAAVVSVLVASAVLGTRQPAIRPDVAGDATAPSVLLITLDTMRADHLGAYGYAKARTPHLDRLAARGVLFRETVAPSIETGPSHASILTGLLPETHGARLNKMRLDRKVDTLAGLLRSEGYVTAAFLSSVTTTDRFCGLPSRFHYFDDNLYELSWLPYWAYKPVLLRLTRAALRSRGFKLPDNRRRGEATTDLAIGWLERQDRRPFFVWVHLFDPHLPYRPSAAAGPGDVSGKWYNLSRQEKTAIAADGQKVQQLIDLYDVEVAYTDTQVGRLFEAAERLASDPGLLTVIVGDHGESMGEHGIYWERDLYDPSLLVPFILVPPASSEIPLPRTVESQVRLIDVAPTILDLLEIPSVGPMEGRSVKGRMLGEENPGAEPAYSAIYRTSDRATRLRFSVRDGKWKLIRRSPGWSGLVWYEQSEELYDLSSDPEELKDRLLSDPAVLEGLRPELAAHETVREVELELTDEERARLRSLGYVY